MNERLLVIEHIEDALKKAFSVFESKGVLTFYIWGSVLRDDYDPEISDVDLLFIFSDSAEPYLQKEIKEYLKIQLPEFKSVGGQAIYMSELHDEKGDQHSFLGTVHPLTVRSILTTFKDWRYVVGKEFVRSDFKAKDLSIEEDIRTMGEQIIDMMPHLDDGKRNWRKDLVKKCLGLIYLRAKANGLNFPLNYNTLAEHAIPSDKSITTLLVNLRKNADYNPETFDSHLKNIQETILN